jgi:hypothetical protein
MAALLGEEIAVLLTLDVGGDVAVEDVLLRELGELGVGERAAL